MLLLYSDDNEYHMKVIQMFATFLSLQCGCDVRFDEWCIHEMARDIRAWYLNEIEKADQIIFVHSEGTYKKYKAHLDMKKLNDTQVPPKGDTFSTIILPVLLSTSFPGPEQQSDDRHVMVRFCYTPPRYQISPVIKGNMYNIPDHLEDLLFHLHDSSRYEPGKISHFPGLNSKEYHKRPEGLKLQEAIESASRYNKDHPEWSDDRYKDPESYKEFLLAKQKGEVDRVSDTSSFTDDNPCNLVGPSELNSQESIPGLMGQTAHAIGLMDNHPNFMAISSCDDENEGSQPSPNGLQLIGNEPQDNPFFDSGISSMNFPGFPPANEDDFSLNSDQGKMPELHGPESMSSLTSSEENLSTYFPDDLRFVDNVQHDGCAIDFGRSSV